MAATQLTSAEEFLALPEAEHDRPWNLVAGEVVMTPATMLHEVVQMGIYQALVAWIDGAPRRGRVHTPIGIRLDATNVFAPDVVWYPSERAPAVRSEPPYALPDLAVEVRSPSTWHYDIGAKKSAYERHGLPELWLVDTAAEQILAFRRSSIAQVVFDIALELDRGDVLKSPLVPGFALALDNLFDVD